MVSPCQRGDLNSVQLQCFHEVNGGTGSPQITSSDITNLAMDFIGSCVAGPNYEKNPTNSMMDPKRTAMRLVKFRSDKLVNIYNAAGMSTLDSGSSPSDCFKCDDGWANSCAAGGSDASDFVITKGKLVDEQNEIKNLQSQPTTISACQCTKTGEANKALTSAAHRCTWGSSLDCLDERFCLSFTNTKSHLRQAFGKLARRRTDVVVDRWYLAAFRNMTHPCMAFGRDYTKGESHYARVMSPPTSLTVDNANQETVSLAINDADADHKFQTSSLMRLYTGISDTGSAQAEYVTATQLVFLFSHHVSIYDWENVIDSGANCVNLGGSVNAVYGSQNNIYNAANGAPLSFKHMTASHSSGSWGNSIYDVDGQSIGRYLGYNSIDDKAPTAFWASGVIYQGSDNMNNNKEISRTQSYHFPYIADLTAPANMQEQTFDKAYYKICKPGDKVQCGSSSSGPTCNGATTTSTTTTETVTSTTRTNTSTTSTFTTTTNTTMSTITNTTTTTFTTNTSVTITSTTSTTSTTDCGGRALLETVDMNANGKVYKCDACKSAAANHYQPYSDYIFLGAFDNANCNPPNNMDVDAYKFRYTKPKETEEHTQNGIAIA